MQRLALIGLIALVGCNDDENKQDGSTQQDLAMAAAGDMATAGDMAMMMMGDAAMAGDAGGGTTHNVTVGPNGAMTFDPMSLTIKAGDTVHWVWGSNLHSVNSGTVATPDDKFCSPSNTGCAALTNATSDLGATYDHTFPMAGSFPYFCKVHGGLGMTGTITVQ